MTFTLGMLTGVLIMALITWVMGEDSPEDKP